ncbi:MAG TPA: IS1182 family transposase [Thermoanaerobaculia bacterium]|nr:IS1182 family transposase [Thermoanaerobaculia bacterium]
MSETLFPFPDAEAPEVVEEEKGEARVVAPNRDQMELRAVDLESLLVLDHPARAVWEFVESLDLSPLYAAVGSVEGRAGRPAVDPRIYMSLWLYAVLEGVGSARAIERLTQQHDAYRWICGGVSVNHHSLADFRVKHVEYLDRVLTHSVAVLMVKGLVKLNRVSQDGIRVRASAGAASFRRKASLKSCLEEAQKQVERLRQELEDDPEATSRRQAAARQRAAEERRRRVAEALAQMPELEAKKGPKEKEKARVSTTDAEARVMKMADGGFRPAYNGQFAVDTATQVVVGVDVSNCGSDQGQLSPMLEQLKARYGTVPSESLVDGGFVGLQDFEQAIEMGTRIYAPVAKPKDKSRDPYAPLATDTPAIAAWRQRMGSREAKEVYKERAASVECVNAQARNRGLQRFLVRGMTKARAVLLWFAIAHNLLRSLTLQAEDSPTVSFA